MTRYKTLNVKLYNAQLNKLKSEVKYGAKVTLYLSSNIIGDDQTSFSHKLLLTNTQASKTCKAFGNGLTANIKFSKTQLSKRVQLG